MADLEQLLIERFGAEGLSAGVDLKEAMVWLRQDAFAREADPIFFKYQRGEATLEEWQSAVDAIRLKFPYPEEQ